MEQVQQFEVSRRFFKPSDILSQGIIFCGLAIIIFMLLLRKEKRSKILGRPLPRLKIRPLSLSGSLVYFPSSERAKNVGLPTASFLLENVLGQGQIFQKEGIFYYRFGFSRFVAIAKAEYVEELLSRSVFLQKGEEYNMLHPWLGTGLLTSHGSKWKSRRKLLTPSFHFDILKDFLITFNEQSEILVNVLRSKADEEWLDVVHYVTLCSLDIICETTLGVHVGAQKDSDSEYVSAILSTSRILMHRLASPLLLNETIFYLTPLGWKFRKIIDGLHGFTRKVIQQKKDALTSRKDHLKDSTSDNSDTVYGRRKRKALMDLLLDVHMNNPEFKEEDIREEIDTFAFEGHDTTSMGISWALYLIGLYPEVQKRVHEELDAIFGDDRDRPATVEDIREMSYLERVLKESQRLYPSVPFFTRRIHEDTNFCGYKMDKDITAVVFVYVLHRNPEVFPNPEKFDPDRFLPENCANRHPFAYVPFSAGPRNCIGQRFAMMEEKTVVSHILRNFHLKSLEHRDKLIPVSELILRTPYPLKMKLTPRD